MRVGAIRRAQAAKGLLDATYPDTQPQDYDQVTWLAGLGSRLAWLPSNFSKEVDAMHKVLGDARTQLREVATRRVAHSSRGREMVRNATALMEEIGVSDV